MDYKIEKIYNTNAKVLFEISVNVKGMPYLVIYGEHVNGNFCSMLDLCRGNQYGRHSICQGNHKGQPGEKAC